MRNEIAAAPPVVFGTSALGNLFVALDDEAKLEIVRACLEYGEGQIVFDTAGKYGAGLALEVLGKCLKQLGRLPDDVIISNKLGWYRTPLTTTEPTFETGVWKNIDHDAVQKISYQGILDCFTQGNELLNGYDPQWVSVHDPDEYLARARNASEEEKRYQDILDAYRALKELKEKGSVSAIGVGSKDWRVIRRIAQDVSLDWVMFANSLTIYHHPEELLGFVRELSAKGIFLINSAVFHSGFLIGSDYFDYQLVSRDNPEHAHLFRWRDDFFEVCRQYAVTPADACVQYASGLNGINSIALSTTSAKRVQQNMTILEHTISPDFWKTLFERELIRKPFLPSSAPTQTTMFGA